ncbi:hypothetical protein E9529_14655 [Blastococcus sp. KM273128]|uniref:hypothetical protein n=1 Tax=Blastococcus sp. KM273128 TaxID=2570314 RepID=UPI001F28C443|nr:hypothetical protein [Blastococcus sp. KM273128]MCF6745488.1 hypothetical protein [Blastococcus sp. KM273128]
MWDDERFIAKAKLYFHRGASHPKGENDVLALWLLLGLEFLLRAPLARVHPTLLADPTGDSIMQAAGLPGKPNSTSPKSIQIRTVIERLGAFVEGFSKDRQDEALSLVGLRNEEMHRSSSPLDVDSSKWLPQFTRVVEVLCKHLGEEPSDMIEEDLLTLGRSLVDREDRRLAHEIGLRIQAAKDFAQKLRPEEKDARKVVTASTVLSFFGETKKTVACPACVESATITMRSVRVTDERIEDEEIVRDVIYLVDELNCPVCELQLKGPAEIGAAKLQQQHQLSEHESFQERYIDNYEPDYGND